jgi:energy-coupling factor transporter ATP-binding protein EcfA2
MHKIKEIRLNNFKFFYGEKTISFDHKHVLLYGENGSGKSSIYWALYTFFQSVFKTDPRQVQKYFLPPTTSSESIKNRYANDGESSYIEILFENDPSDPVTKKVSNTTVNTRTTTFIEQITLSSDFIDYKSIFNIYNFTNRERVKLFKYFEKNLMPFINLGNNLVEIDGTVKSKNLKVWWNYLKKGIDPSLKIKDPSYIAFQALITQFNSDLRTYLNSITETANDYLKDHFKEDIQISFSDFDDCTYNVFNKHNKGRNKKTIAPEIYLTATLLDSNLDEHSSKLERVHTYLNEAKLSSIALAIRMAILKDKFIAESPKILVLDDLLLSLDMGNREAVLNIILNEYCDDYQIIFLTHDKVFFQTVLSFIKTYHANKLRATGESNRQQLERHFSDHWKVLEMYESSLPDKKKVPVILDYRSSIQKAHYYFSDLNNLDYNACGNNLRAALEEFFRGFIPTEFFRNNDGEPKPAHTLTLNPLLNCCIDYFTHLGFDISILDQLNRYRERALNQTSHYNPHSNYFKKELQETFEIINLLNEYRTEALIKKDEFLQLSVTSQSGGAYIYTFKPLDDIRLYLEAKGGAQSLFCPNDKRTYALVGYTATDKSELINPVTNNMTLQEFYEATITGLEAKIGEPCTREADLFEIIKNVKGDSLNELKTY